MNKRLSSNCGPGLSFMTARILIPRMWPNTFNWIKDPANKVRTKNYVHWIDHAEIVDKYTVRLYLNKIFPAVLQYLAGANTMYAEGSNDQDGAQSQNLHPNGTGPYKIVEFELGKKIVFEKFDDYYRESPKAGKRSARNPKRFATASAFSCFLSTFLGAKALKELQA